MSEKLQTLLIEDEELARNLGIAKVAVIHAVTAWRSGGMARRMTMPPAARAGEAETSGRS
jgi:hypothetical protein